MNRVKTLMHHILDTRSNSVKIQVSNVKGEASLFKTFDDALEYKFVRFGNAHFIPAISVDIDTHQDIGLVSKIIVEKKLPTPNFIVKTTKGLHIHWVLGNAISTKHLSSIRLYQRVADSIIKAFGSDVHAMPKNSGRMFRNPLVHPTTYFTGKLYSLKDFTHLLPVANEATSTIPSSRRSTRGYKVPNFATIKEGSRNSTLFDYGRHVAYRYGNKVGLRKTLLSVLVNANKALPSPLPLYEIDSIVTSIYTFMQTKYNCSTVNSKVIAFNRRLAAKQSKLKQVELLKKWVSLGILSIKHLKSMSFREGGRLFKVSPQTFKKHRDSLVMALQSLPLATLKMLRTFKVESIPNFSMYDLLYIPVTVDNNVKCNGPPLAT